MASPAVGPMWRMVIGCVVTLLAFAVDPSLGYTVAATSGLWVLLGVGTVMHRAVSEPTQHNVNVAGAVAHVVVQPDRPPPPRPRQQLAPPSKVWSFVECPECSMLADPAVGVCPCGWIAEHALEVAPPTSAPRSAAPRLCPACPQCRAPTQWMSEFERFFCARCDAYLEP